MSATAHIKSEEDDETGMGDQDAFSAELLFPSRPSTSWVVSDQSADRRGGEEDLRMGDGVQPFMEPCPKPWPKPWNKQKANVVKGGKRTAAEAMNDQHQQPDPHQLLFMQNAKKEEEDDDTEVNTASHLSSLGDYAKMLKKEAQRQRRQPSSTVEGESTNSHIRYIPIAPRVHRRPLEPERIVKRSRVPHSPPPPSRLGGARVPNAPIAPKPAEVGVLNGAVSLGDALQFVDIAPKGGINKERKEKDVVKGVVEKEKVPLPLSVLPSEASAEGTSRKPHDHSLRTNPCDDLNCKMCEERFKHMVNVELLAKIRGMAQAIRPRHSSFDEKDREIRRNLGIQRESPERDEPLMKKPRKPTNYIMPQAMRQKKFREFQMIAMKGLQLQPLAVGGDKVTSRGGNACPKPDQQSWFQCTEELTECDAMDDRALQELCNPSTSKSTPSSSSAVSQKLPNMAKQFGERATGTGIPNIYMQLDILKTFVSTLVSTTLSSQSLYETVCAWYAVLEKEMCWRYAAANLSLTFEAWQWIIQAEIRALARKHNFTCPKAPCLSTELAYLLDDCPVMEATNVQKFLFVRKTEKEKLGITDAEMDMTANYDASTLDKAKTSKLEKIVQRLAIGLRLPDRRERNGQLPSAMTYAEQQRWVHVRDDDKRTEIHVQEIPTPRAKPFADKPLLSVLCGYEVDTRGCEQHKDTASTELSVRAVNPSTGYFKQMHLRTVGHAVPMNKKTAEGADNDHQGLFTHTVKEEEVDEEEERSDSQPSQSSSQQSPMGSSADEAMIDTREVMNMGVRVKEEPLDEVEELPSVSDEHSFIDRMRSALFAERQKSVESGEVAEKQTFQKPKKTAQQKKILFQPLTDKVLPLYECSLSHLNLFPYPVSLKVKLDQLAWTYKLARDRLRRQTKDSAVYEVERVKLYTVYQTDRQTTFNAAIRERMNTMTADELNDLKSSDMWFRIAALLKGTITAVGGEEDGQEEKKREVQEKGEVEIIESKPPTLQTEAEPSETKTAVPVIPTTTIPVPKQNPTTSGVKREKRNRGLIGIRAPQNAMLRETSPSGEEPILMEADSDEVVIREVPMLREEEEEGEESVQKRHREEASAVSSEGKQRKEVIGISNFMRNTGAYRVAVPRRLSESAGVLCQEEEGEDKEDVVDDESVEERRESADSETTVKREESADNESDDKKEESADRETTVKREQSQSPLSREEKRYLYDVKLRALQDKLIKENEQLQSVRVLKDYKGRVLLTENLKDCNEERCQKMERWVEERRRGIPSVSPAVNANLAAFKELTTIYKFMKSAIKVDLKSKTGDTGSVIARIGIYLEVLQKRFHMTQSELDAQTIIPRIVKRMDELEYIIFKELEHPPKKTVRSEAQPKPLKNNGKKNEVVMGYKEDEDVVVIDD